MPAPGSTRRAAAVAIVLALLAVGILLWTGPLVGPPPWRPAAGPGAEPGHVPHFEHVLVIVMENKSYDRARLEPYTAKLIAQGAVFTNAYAVGHPSQPNYLALWSGATMGVTDNGVPARGTPFTSENLGHACETKRLAWNAYCEDLPEPGSPIRHAGLYVRKHAPWTNWSNLDAMHARPLPDLEHAIRVDSLPALAFVIPNLRHDTHDSVTGARVGDDWLAAHVPGWLAALGPRGLLVLTWDEDDFTEGNHILTVFAGRLVRPGAASAREMSHFSVLRTITDGLGLAPFGAAAVDSAAVDVWR
jgi:hypothetical protein